MLTIIIFFFLGLELMHLTISYCSIDQQARRRVKWSLDLFFQQVLNRMSLPCHQCMFFFFFPKWSVWCSSHFFVILTWLKLIHTYSHYPRGLMKSLVLAIIGAGLSTIRSQKSLRQLCGIYWKVPYIYSGTFAVHVLTGEAGIVP